jgi:HD superfamily phosphodiesterase
MVSTIGLAEGIVVKGMEMNSTLTYVLDADQRRTLDNVRAAAERIWSRPLHRYYTDHTVTHSERVIGLLDGLTAGMMATPKRLSSAEVFVLLAAAYLHDIGMQDERFAGGDPSASSVQRLEIIRDAHHEVSAEMIYRAAEDPVQAVYLGLPDDPDLVEATALVAKGHRRVDLASVDYDSLVHGDETLRLRLLAALLRFGDELDIDHRRVDLEQMKLLALPVESQLHWWKCQYVGGVRIVDEYIRVAYRFPQDRPDYEELIVPLVEGDIRAKHAALEGVFRADAVKVALGPPQVRLMRAVQPLPPEVEALARKQGVGGKKQDAGSRGQDAGGREREAESRIPTSGAGPRTEPDPTSPAPAPVFDQRGWTVGTQVNVAGNYVDQRAATVIVGDGNVVGDHSRSHVVKDDSPTGDAASERNEHADQAGEVASLRRQLAQARENMRLIKEREAEYVLATDVPLQLVKEKRRLGERIADLAARLTDIGAESD